MDPALCNSAYRDAGRADWCISATITPMALNIKNSVVEKLAGEVAALSGETKTEAIKRALELRKEQLSLNSEDRSSRRHQDLQDFLENEIWPLVPKQVLGKRLSKEDKERILGYGRDGF